LKKVFAEAVSLAVKGGLVGMVLNAVDGTKIRADVSRESGLHEEKLKELLRRLNESVDEVCDQIEEAEEKEEGKEYRLPRIILLRKNGFGILFRRVWMS
jgi:predicted KAP-like P-loop ATPase